jgi:hypothetical protein
MGADRLRAELDPDRVFEAAIGALEAVLDSVPACAIGIGGADDDHVARPIGAAGRVLHPRRRRLELVERDARIGLGQEHPESRRLTMRRERRAGRQWLAGSALQTVPLQPDAVGIGGSRLEDLDGKAADTVGKTSPARLVTVRLGLDMGHLPGTLGLPGSDPRADERADDPRGRRDEGDEDRRLVRHGAEYEATGRRRIWGGVPSVRTLDDSDGQRSWTVDREGKAPRMTLILTAMTHRSVIQLADMRLTNVRTGKVADESTPKMVVHAGRFVLSFAGPASMGREPTARWITSVLSGIQDPGEILLALADGAERIVKRYPPNIRGLAVVGAGWSGEPERPKPIYIQLTNYDFGSGALLPGFEASELELKPNEKVLLLSAGVPLPTALVGEVHELMRRRAGRREERPAEFVAMMLRLARSIAIGQPTVGTRFSVASIPGVRRAEEPPLAGTGMVMRVGNPDWNQVTDLDSVQIRAG